MAKVFYYSKRYSQQGSPIKTVTYNDLFTISREVATVAPYKLGFGRDMLRVGRMQ